MYFIKTYNNRKCEKFNIDYCYWMLDAFPMNFPKWYIPQMYKNILNAIPWHRLLVFFILRITKMAYEYISMNECFLYLKRMAFDKVFLCVCEVHISSSFKWKQPWHSGIQNIKQRDLFMLCKWLCNWHLKHIPRTRICTHIYTRSKILITERVKY